MVDLVSGRPVVTFTGQGSRSRNDYSSQASALGWVVWGRPTAGVDVLVYGTDCSARRCQTADKLGIPKLTYAAWEDAVVTGEV